MDHLIMTSIFDEILKFNHDRKPKLVKFKLHKMAHDSFAFFRGTDHLFSSQWKRLAPPNVGPNILISGDLHLENFGAYKTDDGDFLYDINDFDEALLAPCSLDLVRCAASIILAAQLWNFSPIQTMRTLLTFIDRYRTTMNKSLKTGQVGELALGTVRGPIWGLLQRPMQGNQAKFLDRLTIRDDQGMRQIRRKKERFRSVCDETEKQVRIAVEKHGQSKGEGKTYEVLDVAFRIAGIGSLGLIRYAVLIQGGGSFNENRLLDIKEVREPALLSCVNGIQPQSGDSNARRAMLAQRQLQSRATTGLDVLTIDGQDLRMRELIPEENRTGLNELRKQPKNLRRAVALAGRLTAWAHIRGSRVHGQDRSEELGQWASGPSLDAVIVSAVRFAIETRRDYDRFRHAFDKTILKP